ncbi:hypothetical protein HYW75_05880 [Candidatus Pacearchaeota archaeon]|nr:hypothetical protein [Candidatus Pacearchaeota archaeon]
MNNTDLNKSNREVLVSFFLRAGLAVVFLYAAISAFLNPLAWAGYIPAFVQAIIPAKTFLHIHSIFNILLSVWLLSKKQVFYASIIASLALLAIIFFNYTALDIIFRDVAILFAAIALAIISYKKD